MTNGERMADLVRMLNLLPYFEAHPDRTVMEAARDLGRDPVEIMDDLNRLWCCGLPGHLPDDLVDLDFSYRQVRVTNNQGMDQPLRLTHTEAGALLLTLESLETVPGLAQREAVVSAASKLRGIMGEETAAVYDSIAEERTEESATVMTLRDAMADSRQVAFDYYSISTDTTRSRQVHPAHLFTHEGATYLQAWDARADEEGAHRVFRADRMSRVTMTDQPAQSHAGSLKFDTADPFNFATIDLHAELLLRPEATWLADYYPIELGEHTDTGTVRASMPVGSVDWFLRFALGQSDRVTVKGPASLRAALRQRAKVAAAAYDQPTDLPTGG